MVRIISLIVTALVAYPAVEFAWATYKPLLIALGQQ